jgi:hypothetical protein
MVDHGAHHERLGWMGDGWQGTEGLFRCYVIV